MARQIRGGQHGRKIVSRFPSRKMGRCVWGESPLECDYFNILEFDSAVRHFHAQPFKIEYELDAKRHVYTPDVLVETADAKRVVEVKEAEKAALPENQLIYRIVERICEREGYSFVVALDRDIRQQPRLRNIKLLLRYARTPFGLPERLACSEFFTRCCQQQAPLCELVEFCASRGIQPNSVHALLCHGVLTADLNKWINADSPIRLAAPTA